MQRREDKQKAIELRKLGYSYSQIKEKIGVNKSTLSGWLYHMPLSENRIRELRGLSPKRIERYRNTMRLKKERRLQEQYDLVSKDIGILSKREIFIAGLFLFWGEGGKTPNGMTALSNTDPSVLIFFKQWLKILNVPEEKMRVRLQLYSDMDIQRATKYWLDILQLPPESLRKPYIKKSNLKDITYRTGFGHGTCMILVANKVLNDYILMGIKRLQYLYIPSPIRP